jgi:hypothetical protein
MSSGSLCGRCLPRSNASNGAYAVMTCISGTTARLGELLAGTMM